MTASGRVLSLDDSVALPRAKHTQKAQGSLTGAKLADVKPLIQAESQRVNGRKTTH
jgi:hypothetical protein